MADADGNIIGKVTSGGPSPSLGKNIAMPFVAQRYYRKPKA